MNLTPVDFRAAAAAAVAARKPTYLPFSDSTLVLAMVAVRDLPKIAARQGIDQAQHELMRRIASAEKFAKARM